jgi:hypothetical protein
MADKVLGPINVTGEQGEPKSEETETVKPVETPDIPSVPGLPGFLLDWHLNLFDILLIIFWIYQAILWIFGGMIGSFNPAPATKENLDIMVNDIRNQLAPATSGFNDPYDYVDDGSWQVIPQITITNLPVIIVPTDTDILLKSVYDNFDANNEFNTMPMNKIKGIFTLSGIPEPFDDRYKDYNKLKSEQFTVVRQLEKL